MKNERERLVGWKDNVLDAAKSIDSNELCNAVFKLGFLLSGIMIAIDELNEDKSD